MGAVGLCALVGLVALSASPAGASFSMGTRTYADSGVYCANAEGQWAVQVHGPGLTTKVAMSAANFSLHYYGFSCGYASPATYNTLAVWNHIEKWTGSTASICRSSPWTPNSYGNHAVYSAANMVALGCGSGSYRAHAQARITYAGVNHHSDSSSLAWPLVTSWEYL